jgi:hypothetical protein
LQGSLQEQAGCLGKGSLGSDNASCSSQSEPGSTPGRSGMETHLGYCEDRSGAPSDKIIILFLEVSLSKFTSKTAAAS